MSKSGKDRLFESALRAVALGQHLDSGLRQSLKEAAELENRRTTTVSPDHLGQLWYGVLQGLVPSDSSNSLHVLESTYKVGGREITACWFIGQDSDVPSDVTIYDPRIR